MRIATARTTRGGTGAGRRWFLGGHVQGDRSLIDLNCVYLDSVDCTPSILLMQSVLVISYRQSSVTVIRHLSHRLTRPLSTNVRDPSLNVASLFLVIHVWNPSWLTASARLAFTLSSVVSPSPDGRAQDRLDLPRPAAERMRCHGGRAWQ